MPRKAREQSSTNIYHVMIRGINRQTIFEDNEDRYVFMTELKRCKELSDFRLHAFCLMPNHVHLLMETRENMYKIVFCQHTELEDRGWRKKYNGTTGI